MFYLRSVFGRLFETIFLFQIKKVKLHYAFK